MNHLMYNGKLKTRSEQNNRKSEYHPRKPPSPTSEQPFPSLTNEPGFKPLCRTSRNFHLNTTTVYHLRPPTSLSAAPTWIVAAKTTSETPTKPLLCHPLTLKPHLSLFLTTIDFTKFHSSTLTVSYHTSSYSPTLNKLLLFPHPNHHILVALYNGGKLEGWLPNEEVWRNDIDLYDDIVLFNGDIYALDRGGKFVVITTDYFSFGFGHARITIPVTPFSGLSAWRKRVVLDSEVQQLYLVTRMGPKSLRVYKMVKRGMMCSWVKVKGFDDRQVLFLSSDYYFFMPAGENFNGMQFDNSIVFSQWAFPSYDHGSWTITDSEDDIAVFRLDDGAFSKEVDNAVFPKLNWLPPLWVSNDSLLASRSYTQLESEPDEDEGLDSNSKGEDDEDVQSDLIDHDKAQEGMESDSESQDGDNGQTQCDLDSQQKVQDERVKMMSGRKLETKPSKEFSHATAESAFKSRHHSDIHTTTIYGLYPPDDLSLYPTALPWITATVDGDLKHQPRHPLTLKHIPSYLPTDFDLSKLGKFTLINAVFHLHTSPFDKLLVVPIPPPSITFKVNETNYYNIDLYECNLLALYDGGRLRGCPPRSKEWVALSHGSIDKFDDVTFFKGKIYALDREGKLYVIFRRPSIGNTVIDHPVTPGSEQFGWRKRLVVTDSQIYLVVRVEEKLFHLYKWVTRKMAASWNRVQGFDGDQMLCIARDHYFWLSFELSNVPGRQFENCIMFSEAAFPRYGKDCWEVTQIDRPSKVFCKSDEDLAVFWLDDEIFVREGENDDFPKLKWSPPPWILHVWWGSVAETQSHSPSESYSQSERESEEDEGLDSKRRDENDGKMQSDLIGQDKAQEEMESYADSHDQDGDVQCDLNTQENEDEQEVTNSLLSMNVGNYATEQGTSMRNVTHSIPRVCTSCTIKSHKSDSSTTKFEGFDVRPDLIPTLQKIWRNHGNIILNRTMRSSDIVSRALESLATMVRILEDNSAQSLSDAQADYLSSTLSDLRFMSFKVYWLDPFVSEAVKLHKNKHLLDSLNSLRQLSSQVKQQRVILLDELAQLDEKANKLKEEMTKMSKTIPFSEKVMFDKPLGCGLT